MPFYVVRCGRIPGLYYKWDDCKLQILGFPNSVYRKFDNITDANNFINDLEIKPQLNFNRERVIYVDGGHNRITGKNAFGSVVDGFGNDMLNYYRDLLKDMELITVNLPKGIRTVIVARFSDCESQQNNGAELLAAVAGLRIAIFLCSNGYLINHVLSDSKLIVEWWCNKLKEERSIKMDPNKVRYIEELISLKSNFSLFQGSLTKISGNDNLADLGFHR